MNYDEESIAQIEEKYAAIHLVYTELMIKLPELYIKLTNEQSREYLMQGVGSRLTILEKCVRNIFTIFPVERNDILVRDDLTDIDINLHAFYVNISGILDNLGWVFVCEKDLIGNPEDGKIDKQGVGLFHKKTQAHLGPKIKEYLQSASMRAWHAGFLKIFRDALAHRIPLYVPPAALTDEETGKYMLLQRQLMDFSSIETILQHDQIWEKLDQLGRACPLFAHSFREESRPVFLHAQIIADFMTIDEIVKIFCDSFPNETNKVIPTNHKST
jgi:hypothetical protein